MLKTIIFGQLRTASAALAGWLAATGFVSDGDAKLIAAAVLAGLSSIWSAYEKYKG